MIVTISTIASGSVAIPDAEVGRMTRLRILLATLTVLTALVATVPAAAQPSGSPIPGGNPIPGNGGVFELAWTGDISPPVGEARGDDYGTSELALDGQPDAVALPGDIVYPCGSPAQFTSPVGYHASWGRLKGISYFPALGNHDVCEPGPGSPSWRAYFADQLANLPCTQQTPPCRPDLGYYDRDLDVTQTAAPTGTSWCWRRTASGPTPHTATERRPRARLGAPSTSG
jgi:hypothetical protein